MRSVVLVGVALAAAAGPGWAQTFAAPDPVLQSIWTEGMENSQAQPLAQVLLDSIGPRLTGSPAMTAGSEWLIRKYRGWGIEARTERYGSWRGWRRGVTHLDLMEPRVRSLEATMLAWSPGTKAAVRAGTLILPEFRGAAEFAAWLPRARGKFVLVSAAEESCRPDENWLRWGTPTEVRGIRQRREATRSAWTRRVASTGLSARDLQLRLDEAGAAGILTHRWSEGWGVDKVFDTRSRRAPVVDVSCEDYGLVYRLTENGQGPVLRLQAESEALGDVPAFNTVAVIPGTEKPDEYVVLSAHFDSWDGASGATDNGTGTVTMLEAMRILKKVYPRPKRTILVGHWAGEEHGLVGSRAFAADHPEIVQGLQALFNQDNGTGRVVEISMQGLVDAGDSFSGWFARLPAEIRQHIRLEIPGTPGAGGSDYASFVCHGAPAFNLSALSWDYGTYTWHTNRDTYDKIVFDDLRNNAVLTAMLAYLASEDPQRVSRERRTALPSSSPTGEPGEWPACQVPPRTFSESRR